MVGVYMYSTGCSTGSPTRVALCSKYHPFTPTSRRTSSTRAHTLGGGQQVAYYYYFYYCRIYNENRGHNTLMNREGG